MSCPKDDEDPHAVFCADFFDRRALLSINTAPRSRELRLSVDAISRLPREFDPMVLIEPGPDTGLRAGEWVALLDEGLVPFRGRITSVSAKGVKDDRDVEE